MYHYPGYYNGGYGYPQYPQYYPENRMNSFGWGYNNYGHHHNHHHESDNYDNEYQNNNYGQYPYGYNYYNDPNYENEPENRYPNYDHPYGMNNNYENHNHNQGGQPNSENNQEESNPKDKKEKKEKTNDELILDYENSIRKEIEETTPLISEEFDITILIDDYNLNEEYLKSVQNISKKYKSIRKVRRDGNCFYRSFIFRLFENICIKNDKTLFEKIKQKIMDAKELTGRNGYEWSVVEDFYNLFLKEFTDCFNSLTLERTIRDYLDKLFSDKDKGTYLIYFLRFCIAAYLKDNKEKYQMYIEGPFDEWIRKEVEAIDHVADEIQITACVNYFDIGVKIEYLNKNDREIVKFPDDKPDEQFFIFFLYTPGH